ncbi:MAG: DUF4173 domain-containing protein [Chitinophagales bacterium]|nr:DUF4173 domain-containing protein [Chitinophagales bacterium]
MYNTISMPEEENNVKQNYADDIIVVSLAIIYSYLFYHQDYGINYFIFSLVVIGIFLFRDKSLTRNLKFATVALGTVITGFTSFYYGSWYHVMMNKVSIIILISLAASIKSSLLIAFLNGIYSYLVLPLKMFIYVITFQFFSLSGYGKVVKYILLTIIPIIIAAIFFGIYSMSNPILADYVSHFNLNFVSVGFALFLMYSFFISMGIIKPRAIDKLIMMDETISDNLTKSENYSHSSFFGFLSIRSEIYVAVAVFLLLNVVIGLNNSIDIRYLFIEQILPKGLSYTSFLHQSVNALVFSIFLAIALIMYFFSSRLNFVENAKYIKIVAYMWVVQNFVLAMLCLYKSIQYVDQFGLTYKRLGVFTFLFLAALGLCLTFYKIHMNKTNFFLFRENTWIAYVVLVLLGCIDWDYIITDNNLRYNKDNHIDYAYLLSLDHTGLPLLQKHFFKDKLEYNNYLDSTHDERTSAIYSYDFHNTPRELFINKVKKFDGDMWNQEWQSFCITKSKVNNNLMK